MYQYCMTPSIPKQENAFSQYGSFGHKLLELWAKDEVLECDLGYLWERDYNKNITLPFPYASSSGYDAKYYDAGKSYFDNFSGFGSKWNHILGVEDEFITDIQGFAFKGIADLILQSDETGEILLIDHKSKSSSSMKKTKNQLSGSS